jgi:hypothetical protein
VTTLTSSQVTASFVGPHMVTDVNGWCKRCIECARNKVVQNVHVPLQPIAIPAGRFSHVHMDLVGPLPVTHLVTMVDSSIRWAEVIPLFLPQPPIAQLLYFMVGRCSFEFQSCSHRTMGHSFLQRSGPLSAASWVFSISPQWSTIHKPTRWWSSFTANEERIKGKAVRFRLDRPPAMGTAGLVGCA